MRLALALLFSIFPTCMGKKTKTIDFANHKYGIYELKNGEAELREYNEDGVHDTTMWKLVGTATGDLDGDGAVETVVLVAVSSWTTDGRYFPTSDIHVFDAGATRVKRGDITGIGTALRIEDQTIVITTDDGDERVAWKDLR